MCGQWSGDPRRDPWWPPEEIDLMRMLSRLSKRLSSIASMLAYAGRLIHLKVVIFALPIFLLCAPLKFHLPSHIIMKNWVKTSSGMVKIPKSKVNA